MDICKSYDTEAVYQNINNTEVPYPRDKTLCRIFEEQAARTPNACAVVFGGASLSYRELDRRANQLAGLLSKNGAGRGKIVGILAERSMEMMTGILGILKSGAAYLPISPEYPAKRIEFIISDSGIDCILVQKKFMCKLEAFDVSCINLEDEGLYDGPEYRTEAAAGPEDLAYVIYTSGSTGNPKGVMVEHYSVVNRLNWMQKRYPLRAEDTILQKTPFVFDVSVWELFWWAFAGARVCFLKPGMEKFPQSIIEEVERSNITVMHFVPSMLNSFMNYADSPEHGERLSGLRRVFCSGEALLPSHVMKFNHLLGYRGTCLTNLYGPTEATVDVSYYDCPSEGEIARVPIGKPIDNIRLYVFEGNELQPEGCKGELCISGDGLARGYLRRPELTREKFVDNPVWPGKKMYRTGDFARLLPDGNIEYMGRMDNQVKIRGLRIELGEIESRICEHKSVQQCIVLLKDADKINPVLTAYVLTADSSLTPQTIKSFLRAFLPEYMIPNSFVLLDSFPVTSNGKADRAALAILQN